LYFNDEDKFGIEGNFQNVHTLNGIDVEALNEFASNYIYNFLILI